MKKRILVVGGVAGGASAAARVKRIDSCAEVVIFEKGPHVSFSNCALPFYLSGVVEKSSSLILMDPERFKKQYDIDARVNSEVLHILRGEKKIQVKNLKTGEICEESYDKLILSPGAAPVLPGRIPGIHAPHVFSIRNVVDIKKLKDYIDAGQIQEIAVVGGGFIGVEVAENLRSSGKQVSLIEADRQIMAPFDYDMVQILHKEMLDQGVDLIVNDGVKEITEEEVVLASGKRVAAKAVVMAIGVVPETGLAKDAQLEIGETGGIKVNHNYQTSDPDIYAVGDAIEVYHQITHKPSRLALAGPAQRQARAAADAVYGIPHQNKGVVGSCVVRCFRYNAAATGINEKTAQMEGIPYDFVYLLSPDKVSLMPGSKNLYFKLLFEYPTGRLLGAQAIGEGAADKRIDVIAAMIQMGGTLEDLKELELCYAPLYGTAKDVVNQAALAGLNLLYGYSRQVPVSKVRELVEQAACIIDVRERKEYERGHIIHAKNIPLSELRGHVDEIPKDRPVYLHCHSGKRSYYALRTLAGLGFDNLYNVSGSYLGICLYEYYNDVVMGRERIVTEYNFK